MSRQKLMRIMFDCVVVCRLTASTTRGLIALSGALVAVICGGCAVDGLDAHEPAPAVLDGESYDLTAAVDASPTNGEWRGIMQSGKAAADGSDDDASDDDASDDASSTSGLLDVSPPDGCAYGLPKFFKCEPPQQSLTIEIGAVDPTGTFIPYNDDDLVPIVHGMQGGFHVFAAIRVNMAGAKVPMLKLQIDARLYDGCAVIGYAMAPIAYAKAVSYAKEPGIYLIGSAAMAGMMIVFDGGEGGIKSSYSKAYADRKFDLRVAVREVYSKQWGAAQRRILTYDTAH